MPTLMAESMADKKVEDLPVTTIKVTKDVYHRVARIAKHRKTSVRAITEQLLAEFADTETRKMIAEMQKELRQP